jgi:hypothetical protein
VGVSLHSFVQFFESSLDSVFRICHHRVAGHEGVQEAILFILHVDHGPRAYGPVVGLVTWTVSRCYFVWARGVIDAEMNACDRRQLVC